MMLMIEEIRKKSWNVPSYLKMNSVGSQYLVGGYVFLFLSMPLAIGQSGKIELIKDCVKSQTTEIQNNSSLLVKKRGRVECKSAAIVGFPPRVKKYNNNGGISVEAGEGRIICLGRELELVNVSDNGGGNRNFEIPRDRRSVSVPIHCRGAGIGQGRRWYEATLQAYSCLSITDEMILDHTLECAAKLAD